MRKFRWAARVSLGSALAWSAAFLPAWALEPPAAAAVPANDLNLGGLLAHLAVVVLVVESALAAIFQWRVYQMVFNNRSMKTVVMVAVGLLVVIGFHYDVFNTLMTMVAPQAAFEKWGGEVSILLSALIIAGGSSGMNLLLQRLGFRNPVSAAPEQPLPKWDEAWISIHANQKQTTGPLQIGINEIAADGVQSAPLAGTIQRRNFFDRLKESFLADSMRFPNYGGRSVAIGKTYEIVISGKKAKPDDASPTLKKTIYEGQFAARAIVDFVVDM